MGYMSHMEYMLFKSALFILGSIVFSYIFWSMKGFVENHSKKSVKPKPAKKRK